MPALPLAPFLSAKRYALARADKAFGKSAVAILCFLCRGNFFASIQEPTDKSLMIFRHN